MLHVSGRKIRSKNAKIEQVREEGRRKNRSFLGIDAKKILEQSESAVEQD